jgi:DNA-directed RNA polymerase specialized sigma subunit
MTGEGMHAYNLSVLYNMKIVDIANEIYMELGEPKTLSIPPVAFWLRTNIGALNSKLNTTYAVNLTSFEISPTMGQEEKDIFKKLYLIHYYDVKLRESLGAASTDTWIEIQSDGTSVRRVNKVEQGKTYQTVKKVELEELDKMVHSYKLRASSPLQVAGDDTVVGSYSPNKISLRERE